MSPEELFTKKQLSAKLNCSEDTIDRYVKSGLPYYPSGLGKVKKDKRFDFEEVLDWLKKREEMSA